MKRSARAIRKIVSSTLSVASRLIFAHIRALPQSKPMDENSCEHDFHPYDSDWLNYYVNILSKAISRVMSLNGHLSRTAVTGSLKQPTRKQAGRPALPVWSCFGWGLQSPACYQAGGSLLHCLSTLTARKPAKAWHGTGQRYISVALSLESPPPDVIWHPAL